MATRPDIDFVAASAAGLGLAAESRGTSEVAAWANTVPERLHVLVRRWDVVSLVPLDHVGTASWIGECVTRDDSSGILKLAFPHDEGRDEIEGLRLCDGNPTVRLLRHARELDAMLLERCTPGTRLSERPEWEQDEVIGALLRQLRRAPFSGSGIRPLSSLIEVWEKAGREKGAEDPSPMVERGLDSLHELLGSSSEACALATDLHAGNVLSAERMPWLVIDPKPYTGDPAFDVTQHLLNCPQRLRRAPRATLERACALAGVDAERTGRWLTGRLQAQAGWDPDPVRAVVTVLSR